MFQCKFCGKECKSARSVRSHQPLCKSNPDGKSPSEWATGNRKGKPSWNKGLVGDDRCKHSIESKQKMSAKMAERPPEWHKENGLRISKTIQRKVEEGSWHTSLARHMHIDYKGNDMHGTWEVKFAMYLDSQSIEWVRNKETFLYLFEGKIRRYTPDFFLPETEEFVEIKGYSTEKDKAKWSQFPSDKKLRILMKDELRELGICV